MQVRTPGVVIVAAGGDMARGGELLLGESQDAPVRKEKSGGEKRRRGKILFVKHFSKHTV